MPKRLSLKLTSDQRRDLEHLRDHAALPYLRERAAALLKIAAGASARTVAAEGLLKRRWHRTVGRWVARYEQAGVTGLQIRAGRGRKPAFSPHAPERRRGPGRTAASGRARA